MPQLFINTDFDMIVMDLRYVPNGTIVVLLIDAMMLPLPELMWQFGAIVY
jgi:hypothetical protein